MKSFTNEISGHYLGTEIDGNWLECFKENKMFVPAMAF